MENFGLGVTIGTPSRGEVSVEYKTSLIETMFALSERQIPFNYIDAIGSPVVLVRNRIAAAFLADSSRNLFFIDADVGWPAAKVVEFLERPEPIILGVPRMKDERLQYPCNFFYDESGQIVRKNGLLKAITGPAGFMRIKREALEAVVQECRIYTERGPWGPDDRPVPALFEDGIGPDDTFWGEDVTFIRKAISLGIDVLVDPDIEFAHRGNHVFRGKLGDIIDH